MKSSSTKFNIMALTNGARYYAKVTVGSTTLTQTLNNFKYAGMSNADNDISIGNTCAASVSFSIYKPTVSLENKEITIYEGLLIDGAYEYMKLGLLEITKQTDNGEYTSYEGVDRMASKMEMGYFSSLSFPSTDAAILAEVCSQVGISFATTITATHTISEKPSGYTRREIIGYMAALQGKNAVINADGNLELRWYTATGYTIGSNKTYQGDGVTFTTSKDFVIKLLTCTVGNSQSSTTLTSGTGATGIIFENPFMTQAILDEIYGKIGGFAYRPMTVKFVGDFRLEVGDIVTVNKDGADYSVPIMQVNHECDGGVITTIKSVGKSDSDNGNAITGPITKQMQRYYADLLIVNQEMVNKLDVDTANITYATINSLTAVKGRIDVLETTSLTATEADIKYAKIDLSNIANGTITNAMIGTAAVDTTQIKDGSITDAKIVTLTANKLTAGTIDASKISVTNLNCANLTVGTINGQQIAPGAIDMTNLSTSLGNAITTAGTTAATALNTANGKNKVYYQTTAPAGTDYVTNDLWFDTDDGNKIYTWSGTAWVAAQFGASAIADSCIDGTKLTTTINNTIDTANTNASTALTNAGLAQTVANNATAIANGKNAVYYQSATPSGGTYKTNDIWFDTDGGNTMYYYNGTTWTLQQFSTGAIASGAITSTQIASSTILAGNITSGAITTDKLYALAVTGDKIAANTITAAKMVAGTITAASGIIADAAIATAKIADGAITTAKIGTAQITNALIADATIDSAKIANINAGKITAGTLSVQRLELVGSTSSLVYALNNSGSLTSTVVNTLDGDVLTPRTITADRIVVGAITANEIAATTITGNKLVANTITADKLNVTSLSAISANLGTVTAGILRSTNYVSGTSGMQLNLATGTWDSKHTQISSTGNLVCSGGNIGGITINTSGLYSTNNSTFGPFTSSDIAYASNLVTNKNWTDADLAKYDVNGDAKLDGQDILIMQAMMSGAYPYTQKTEFALSNNTTTQTVISMKRYITSSTDVHPLMTSIGAGIIITKNLGFGYGANNGVGYIGVDDGSAITYNAPLHAFVGDIYANGILTTQGVKNNAGWADWYNGNTLRGSIFSNYTYEGGGFAVVAQLGNLDLKAQSSNVYVHDNLCVVSDAYANRWLINSARKYKTNIADITESEANKILAIKPVSYNLKSDMSQNYGVIADDCTETTPSLVNYKNGAVEAYNYIGLIPLLVKKVQMQDAEIKALQARLQAMA